MFIYLNAQRHHNGHHRAGPRSIPQSQGSADESFGHISRNINRSHGNIQPSRNGPSGRLVESRRQHSSSSGGGSGRPPSGSRASGSRSHHGYDDNRG